MLSLTTVAALLVVASASAHARLSPPVALAKEGQVFTLVVPTEKEGAATTQVVLTVPDGFAIDSFLPSPGWRRSVQQTGSGEDAVIQKVTWSGGSVAAPEAAAFEFAARTDASKTYTFSVEQTYDDGSVVEWSGPESSDTPAPTVEATSSLGGGGTSILAIIALVVGALGVVLGVAALLAASGRQLA
jgi:uncharacterized protein YcnI